MPRHFVYALFVHLLTWEMAATAATISSIGVTNNSSPDDAIAPNTFQTQSSLSLLGASANTVFFTHRMAFHNQYTASGGVAQVHKRNVIYQIDFTVEDPDSRGFSLQADSFLRGQSSVTLTSEGSGNATGASFFVEIDDSTDPPNTFATFTPLFNNTGGAAVDDVGSDSILVENSESALVGDFVGTTTFSFSFSTVPTPTTNVFFGNNRTGSGEVDYLSSNFFGHFVTFGATFHVPEPTPLALLMSAISWLFCRRSSYAV